MRLTWFRDRWERTGAVLAALIGLALVIAGWVGISGASLTTEQLPYIASGAIGGLFAIAIAGTLWLSADLRDEYWTLEEIFEWMRNEELTEPAGQEQALGGGTSPTTPMHDADPVEAIESDLTEPVRRRRLRAAARHS